MSNFVRHTAHRAQITRPVCLGRDFDLRGQVWASHAAMLSRGVASVALLLGVRLLPAALLLLIRGLALPVAALRLLTRSLTTALLARASTLLGLLLG